NRPQRSTQVVRNTVAEGLKLFIGSFELGRALDHPLFQLVARNRGRLLFLGHLVEGACQLPDLVLGGDAELEIEVARTHDRGAFAQLREWPGHASESQKQRRYDDTDHDAAERHDRDAYPVLSFQGPRPALAG